tara:strand:+ start:740 stop:1819 length:1080 start_codon:yes stop_codon:yes gene_type:complete
MNKKIIFTAGGTGGHIFPAINLMKHFSQKNIEVLLVTDNRGKNFIKNSSKFKSYILKAGTFTNKNFFNKIFSFFIIFYSIIKSLIILKKEKPNLIFGFGGYVSFPISFVSRFFKIPLIIYENNVILGRTNKYLLSIAKKIFVANMESKNFPTKYKHKVCEIGSILDKSIINNLTLKKNDADNSFSILVLGGSQGAEIFGKTIPPVIKMIVNKGYKIKIIQQCIGDQKKSIVNYYLKNNIDNYVFSFDENIFQLMLSSNLAITRCGASAIAELAQTLTPFIAVPLPNSIDNHQYLNAKYYEKKGCCWILTQDNFNNENLFNLIIEKIEKKNKLRSAQENMKKNFIKEVYTNIDKQIVEFI